MNGYGGKLPITGATGLAVGGLVLNQLYLLAGAAVLVLGGALMLRRTWRRNKTVSER